MKKMMELAENAVEAAKVWKLDLDYTTGSLEPLDRLSQRIYSLNRNQPLPEEMLFGVAGFYGAYLGEVLLRSGLKDLGFTWMKGENDVIGIGKEDFWVAPVEKVYKRITQGPEHDLMSFFEVVFGLAVGAVNPDDPRLHRLDEEEAG